MVSFEEMKERYPRAMIVVQGLWIIVFATIISYVLISPLYIFNIDAQIIIDIFTFPADIIPQPYNLVGILALPVGMILVAWANYALLHVGRIGLRAREPMQTPSTLVVTGPYQYSRNPIYLGVLIMAMGLTVVWSSLIMVFATIAIYAILRYVFIKSEEIILEEKFGNEYRDFKKRVRRWL